MNINVVPVWVCIILWTKRNAKQHNTVFLFVGCIASVTCCRDLRHAGDQQSKLPLFVSEICGNRWQKYRWVRKQKAYICVTRDLVKSWRHDVGFLNILTRESLHTYRQHCSLGLVNLHQGIVQWFCRCRFGLRSKKRLNQEYDFENVFGCSLIKHGSIIIIRRHWHSTVCHSKEEEECVFYIHGHDNIMTMFTVSCKKLVIFYSIITFSYTKYCVHSYTVDVVFTLSY